MEAKDGTEWEGELIGVSPEEFLIWFRIQVNNLRKKIYTSTQEEIRDEINKFFGFYLERVEDKKIRCEINLLFYELLNQYGYYFNSEKTFENMIVRFNDSEIKQDLLSKYPIRFKLIYSTSLLAYFNLKRTSTPPEEIATKDFITPALPCKFYLTSVYNEYLTNNNVLNKHQLVRCLSSLGGYLGMLSRWYEALYFLNLAQEIDPTDPVTVSMKAGVLEGVEEKTCSDYSSILLLETYDLSRTISKSDQVLESDKPHFRELEKRIRKTFRTHKISISKVRSHKTTHARKSKKYSDYEKFCLDKALFLTEHSIYCVCKKSMRDDIKIRSGHEHTQIEYVDRFESILSSLRYDFILARQNYYHSLPNSYMRGFNLKNIKSTDKRKDIKDALLKDSFRLCYSVLDTIGITILEALDIDYVAILKEKYPEQRVDVHFTNLWDLDLIPESEFKINYYLQSLYSIAYEMKNEKYSGLKKYREIRNAIEHRIFHITDERVNNKKGKSEYYIQRKELQEMTQVLLVYTKSLIFTYVNFIRKVSVYKDPEYQKKYGDERSISH
ncbi:MAG: hypothetical protein Crog4KO_01700 [Crocinitomicaceae bacterium]